MADKTQKKDPVKCWKVGEGQVDFKTIDIDGIKETRAADFLIIPKSFLATGIKADSTIPLIGQSWLSSYEQGVEILVLVDGSGLFTIANMSAKDGFMYLKSIKQKSRPANDFTRAFIVMSMTDGNKELDDIRDSLVTGVQLAAQNLGMPEIQVERADDRQGSTYRIDEAIFSSLESCGLILCDLTEEKPNCYFELAWAMAHQRQIVVTAKKGTKIHFDVSRFNIRFWDSQRELRELVRKDAESIFIEQRKART
jgi:hypothetical protein